MMKDTDPLTVVRGYLDAYTSNDISAAATYLADDFDFEGPFVHATSAKEFIGDGTDPAWPRGPKTSPACTSQPRLRKTTR